MFLGVKCWRRKDLTSDKIREAGASIGLPASLVEREIIFYDTLEAICSCSPTPVALKGGTLISRLYSECPRFSWDIDLSAAIRVKEDYRLQALNRRMGRDRRIKSIEIGGKLIYFGKFERDREKDVFVDLLSLKRDMVTPSLGTPLPTYLRKEGLKVEKLRGEISKLKGVTGFLPFVDSVRATVSLAEPPIKARRVGIRSVIEDVLKPAKVVKIPVYPPELCLVEKFSRMSKGIDEVGSRDLLCDFYDIGQLMRLGLDRKRILECFRDLYSQRKIAGVGTLRKRIGEDLSFVKRNLDLFEKRREFTWCKYDWGEFFSNTEKGIKSVLEDLNHLI